MGSSYGARCGRGGSMISVSLQRDAHTRVRGLFLLRGPLAGN